MEYRDVFQKKNSLIVVVHANSEEQVLRNVKIADENGANGVFLISHERPFNELFDMYGVARNENPDFWIGLNAIDLFPSVTIDFAPSSVSGLWVDNAFFSFKGFVDDNVANAKVNWEARKAREDWNGLYFGGVAFKYQKSVEDCGLDAKQAMPFVDVVTTSGDATGHPPSVEKITKMREAIGDFPLAIASGMNPVNVKEYCGLVDCFLVATGISRNFTELEPVLVRKFVKAIE